MKYVWHTPPTQQHLTNGEMHGNIQMRIYYHNSVSFIFVSVSFCTHRTTYYFQSFVYKPCIYLLNMCGIIAVLYWDI